MSLDAGFAVATAGEPQDLEDPFYAGTNPFVTGEREFMIQEILAGRGLLRVYMASFGLYLGVIVALHLATKISGKACLSKESMKERTKVVAEDLESTPLLSAHQRHKPLRRLYLWFEGVLMKQPQGRYCSWLEDYGTMLTLACYYLSNLIFLCYRYSYIIVFAFRLGLLCVANIPLMYILAAKHTPFSWLTGWSYEQLNVFHRHVGRVCVGTLIAHTLIFLWYFRPAYLFTHLWSVMGITAGTSFIVIGLSSIRFFRQKCYELFYAIHFVGMIVALPAIYFHHPVTRPFTVVAALSVVYDRALRVAHDYRLVHSQVEVHSGDTVIIRIPKVGSFPLGLGTNWLGRPLAWNTGQHIFITVVGCGLFESHPFTIASSSETSDTMDLIIRACDGFTKRLLNQQLTRPEGQQNRWVILHGPYGVHPAAFKSQTANRIEPPKIVLVAGGAGVAFTYPFYDEFRRLLDRQANNELLSNKLLELQTQGTLKPDFFQSETSSVESITPSSSCSSPATDSFNALTQVDTNIEFLWIIPHRNYIGWLRAPGLRQSLLETDDSPREPRVRARVWVTREAGRPDIGHEVKSMVGRSSGGSRECWVLACGPDELTRQVRNTVAELRMSGRDDVNLYAEKFGW